MENITKNYRLALRYLKKVHGPSTEKLARIGGCTVRHLQGILSEKEKKGVGGEIGQKIAEYFGISYNEMLKIGEVIACGGDPDGAVHTRVHVSTEYKDSQHHQHQGAGDLNANVYYAKEDMSPEEQVLLNLLREKDATKSYIRRFMAELLAAETPKNG